MQKRIKIRVKNWQKFIWSSWAVGQLGMSQIGDSLVKIDTKFRDYLMSFVQLLFVFHGKT